MFELITPLSYWFLVILWSIILILYLTKMRNISARGGSIAILLTILALDAFRTLFESIYFGLYFNSNFGFLPQIIGTTLGNSQYLFIPKLINIIAGVLVLIILIRRWIPKEVAQEQKQNQELKASVEQKNLAIAGSNLGTWDWYIESKVLKFNERFAGILGFELDEFDQTINSWENRIHPDDKEFVMQKLNNHLEGTTDFYETEHRLRHKSEKWVWVHDQGKVIERDADGKPVRACGTLLDISERKMAEEERWVTADIYQNLLHSLKAGVVVHAKDGSVVISNTAACSILGLTSDQMRGKEIISSSWSFLRGDSSVMPHQEYPVSRILATKKPIHDAIVGVLRPSTQDVAWVLVDGFPTIDEAGDIQQIVITFIDFTERQLAENEQARLLHESTERVKELACMYGVAESIRKSSTLDEVFDQVISHIPPGWQYPEITCGRIRYNDKEFISQPFQETEWQLSSDITVDGVPQGTVDVFYLEKRPIIVEGPFLKEERHLIDGIARTIGEAIAYRQEEARRKVAEEQLVKSQKMEAIGQLTGGIAHDLNNILQAVTGYSEMAKSDLSQDNNAHQYVSQILIAGERGATLVRHLLAFSRQQVLELKNLDLNDVVRDLMEMVKPVIGEHISLEVLPGHQLGIVRADPGQIEQILMNLYVNARDAMPTGGTITIETENVRVDQDFCLEHPWAKPGRYVLLSVSDNGCGMDSKTLANIFEPFFTTKDVGEGTGLGLSTVYGLVKQHRGMIHTYSEVGKGTIFKIYLPVVERMATSVGIDIQGPVLGGTETILLAEDDATVLGLAKTILEQVGYTVFTASNGEEAIQIFDDNANEIDLALLDVMMPKLGGKAVSERIREKQPEMRFIFASGYSMNAIHTNFVLDDGMQLVQKPYQRDSLLRHVRAALDAENELAVAATGSNKQTPTKANILLIDDDSLTRNVIREMLDIAGHNVTEAANGNEGCLCFRNNPSDLVITDIIMPEKEGLETIQDLKKDFPDVKIIAISGGSRGKATDYLSMAKKFGADFILKKPVSSGDLLDAVERVLAPDKP